MKRYNYKHKYDKNSHVYPPYLSTDRIYTHIQWNTSYFKGDYSIHVIENGFVSIISLQLSIEIRYNSLNDTINPQQYSKVQFQSINKLKAVLRLIQFTMLSLYIKHTNEQYTSCNLNIRAIRRLVWFQPVCFGQLAKRLHIVMA